MRTNSQAQQFLLIIIFNIFKCFPYEIVVFNTFVLLYCNVWFILLHNLMIIEY